MLRPDLSLRSGDGGRQTVLVVVCHKQNKQAFRVDTKEGGTEKKKKAILLFC